MSDEGRRDFLGNSARLLVGLSSFAAAEVFASQPGGHLQPGSGDGLEIDAAAEDTCGTCQYWGGMRRLSEDKGKVIAQSMGWCNNPESMNHNKLTTADHRMRKTGIWKRWGVI